MENEKGGNAFGATKKQQPLGRASTISIICRLLEVKGFDNVSVQRPTPAIERTDTAVRTVPPLTSKPVR